MSKRYTLETTRDEAAGDVVTLTDNDAGVSISCIPKFGMIMSSCKLRLGDDWQELFHVVKRPPTEMRDGMWPVLFPVVGRVRTDGGADGYDWNGTLYPMQIHGFASEMPWRIHEAGMRDGCPRVRATLTPTDETRRVYPFEFEFSLEYCVAEGVIEVIPTVWSEGPFSFGFHPFFRVPIAESPAGEAGCTVTVPCRGAWEGGLYPTGGTIPLPPSLPIDKGVSLKGLDIDMGLCDLTADSDWRHRSTLRDEGSGVELVLDADAKVFSNVVVYRPADAPFICIENWTSPANAINGGWELFSAGTRMTTVLRFVPRRLKD